MADRGNERPLIDSVPLIPRRQWPAIRYSEKRAITLAEHQKIIAAEVKTGVPVLVHLGSEALSLFKHLRSDGELFPYLASVRAGDRATGAALEVVGHRCPFLKLPPHTTGG